IFSDFLRLQDYGLVLGAEGMLSKTLTIGDHGGLLQYRKHAVYIKGTPQQLRIPDILLTKVGREVAKILDPIDSIERAKELAAILPKHGLTEIAYVEVEETGADLLLQNPVMLWEAQSATQQATPSPSDILEAQIKSNT